MTSPDTAQGPLLLVDDSPDELLLMQMGLKRAGIDVPQVVVGSGNEALDYLFARGKYAGRDTAVQPRLVLMDLHMPGKSGVDTLREIRANPATAAVKVVIFSSSEDPVEIVGAHDQGANSFLCKPLSVTGMQSTIKQLRKFWLHIDLPVAKKKNGED
ncbi:MAG TPA: response regulator [Burkholderiales bacterium]|jgi:two-component system response regulator|nr:response regulator [Burkholderiales bacterium]